MTTLPRFAVPMLLVALCINRAPAQGKFDNPDTSPAKRAHDLVSSMTVDEQISQMQNSAVGIARLGIPSYNWWNEALHGVARAGVATVFPQAIGLAATWDPDLLRKEADVISTEARAKYRGFMKRGYTGIYQGLTFWSPNINIFRDPRWGRGQETYGEDPFLTARMGVAFVRGMQGEDPQYFKTIATPKHFAVHSGPEPLRHQFDARPPIRDLYETYLPAFEAAIVEGGAWSIMGAYNRVYGEPCCASTLLLEEILRGRWKFKGYVVSDCGAIDDIYARHMIVHDVSEASAAAVLHGCDLTCGGEYQSLNKALDAGLITRQDIAASVERLMEARFRLGMFDPPDRVPYSRISESEYDTPGHDSLARVTARESIVLLKNQDDALPLTNVPHSIAVIGPLADDVSVLLGNYKGTPSHPVTVFDGIRSRAGREAVVMTAAGTEIADGMPRLDPVPPGCLTTSDQGTMRQGLSAEYFDNQDLAGKPVLVRVDSSVVFDWRDGSPDPSVPSDHFSARWTGMLTPDFTGSRIFGAVADDGCRVFLDDSLLVEAWQPGSSRQVAKEVFFQAGKSYSIRLEYFEQRWGASVRLGWAKIPGELETEAMALARSSDLIVAVMGISPDLEGEEMEVNVEGFSGGDRTSLNIPQNQERLLKEIAALGKPVILVLLNGSALSIPWEQEHLPAIIEAWYPGQQGGNAVADVLFGDYNPAGRLPVTFYSRVEDLPAFDNYAMTGRTYRYFQGTPLFPFGYGLSYSRFTYRGVSTSKPAFVRGDTIDVDVRVKNSGTRDGDEIVQVYSRCVKMISGDPIKSLKGFQRVHLRAGEERSVTVRIPVRELRVYDEGQHDYVVRGGEYELQVGASSADIRLKKTIRIQD